MSESNSNLIRCQNHHLFSRRRHGTKCPYCGLETVTYEMEDIKKRVEAFIHSVQTKKCVHGSYARKESGLENLMK